MNKSPLAGLGAVVMAAGLGKRMKSKLAKVLHPVAGRPMVLYAVDLARQLAGEHVAVVVGYQGKEVRTAIEASRPHAPVMVVEQTQQLGTGHAVQQARDLFKRLGKTLSTYLILNGDTPLLQPATLQALLRLHQDEQAAVTLLTATPDDPAGYGRVVRGRDGRVQKIVEDRDATGAEKQIHEINVGTYVTDGPFLFDALDKLQPRNAQGEYYLTDIVSLAVERGLRVSALAVHEAAEGMGINTREQLAAAEQTIRRRICAHWMQEGVTLRNPAMTSIDADVAIGRDTVIHPDVTLEGRTIIGEDCIVRSHTRISDSTQVGNFVEMKKAELGEGSKANHLSYLGDATIGKGVNIGAGTITCNYDGHKKHETVIGDDVFVGSDTQFVAPVTIGKGAVIAAGATITADVPSDTLAIARAAQINRPGWASRQRALQTAVSRETLDVKRKDNSGRLASDVSRLTKKRALGIKGNKARKRTRG